MSLRKSELNKKKMTLIGDVRQTVRTSFPYLLIFLMLCTLKIETPETARQRGWIRVQLFEG